MPISLVNLLIAIGIVRVSDDIPNDVNSTLPTAFISRYGLQRADIFTNKGSDIKVCISSAAVIVSIKTHSLDAVVLKSVVAVNLVSAPKTPIGASRATKSVILDITSDIELKKFVRNILVLSFDLVIKQPNTVQKRATAHKLFSDKALKMFGLNVRGIKSPKFTVLLA